MNLKEMEAEMLEARSAEILAEVENTDDLEKLSALNDEAKAIKEELEARKAEAAEKMIDEAVELYNDTRYAYKLDDKISYKKFYDGLITNYLAKMSDILTRLNGSLK